MVWDLDVDGVVISVFIALGSAKERGWVSEEEA